MGFPENNIKSRSSSIFEIAPILPSNSEVDATELDINGFIKERLDEASKPDAQQAQAILAGKTKKYVEILKERTVHNKQLGVFKRIKNYVIFYFSKVTNTGDYAQAKKKDDKVAGDVKTFNKAVFDLTAAIYLKPLNDEEIQALGLKNGAIVFKSDAQRQNDVNEQNRLKNKYHEAVSNFEAAYQTFSTYINPNTGTLFSAEELRSAAFAAIEEARKTTYFYNVTMKTTKKVKGSEVGSKQTLTMATNANQNERAVQLEQNMLIKFMPDFDNMVYQIELKRIAQSVKDNPFLNSASFFLSRINELEKVFPNMPHSARMTLREQLIEDLSNAMHGSGDTYTQLINDTAKALSVSAQANSKAFNMEVLKQEADALSKIFPDVIEPKFDQELLAILKRDEAFVKALAQEVDQVADESTIVTQVDTKLDAIHEELKKAREECTAMKDRLDKVDKMHLQALEKYRGIITDGRPSKIPGTVMILKGNDQIGTAEGAEAATQPGKVILYGTEQRLENKRARFIAEANQQRISELASDDEIEQFVQAEEKKGFKEIFKENKPYSNLKSYQAFKNAKKENQIAQDQLDKVIAMKLELTEAIELQEEKIAELESKAQDGSKAIRAKVTSEQESRFDFLKFAISSA